MSLITPAQVREHHAHLTGSAEDALLTTLIAQADAYMSAFCEFPTTDSGLQTLEDETYTLKIGAPWAGDARRLDLGIRPIVNISSVTLDTSGGEFTYSTTVQNTEYVIDNQAGQLWLKTTSTNAWLTGPLANKVVAVAGFATTPLHLVAIAADAVVHLLQQRKSRGLEDVSVGGASVSRPDALRHLPQRVQDALSPFVLWGRRLG